MSGGEVWQNPLMVNVRLYKSGVRWVYDRIQNHLVFKGSEVMYGF